MISHRSNSRSPSGHQVLTSFWLFKSNHSSQLPMYLFHRKDTLAPQALPQIPVGQVVVVATPAWDSSKNAGGMYLRWDPTHVLRWAKGRGRSSWSPGAGCGDWLQVWRQEGQWRGRQDLGFKL